MEDIQIELLGRLKSHPDVPDEWLISEPVEISFFDGKEISFTIQIDLNKHKNALTEANQAIENFLKKDALDKLNFTSLIYEHYKQIQHYYDSKSWGAMPLELKDKDEIWRFVYPGNGYICRSPGDEYIYVLITCECEWEPEHGLQLVFKNGLELTKVSEIDYDPIG